MAASIISSVRPCQNLLFRRTAIALQQQTVKQWKNPVMRLMSTDAPPKKNYNYVRYGLGVAAVAGGGLIYFYSMMVPKIVRKIHSTGLVEEEPAKKKFEPDMDTIKRTSIKRAGDTSGLKLTLFQYRSCPFCCKTRAYLDYYGLSYDVVEVNSVTRAETKWTPYRKVPILVCHGAGDDGGVVQLNDSSLIMSALESYLEDRSRGLEQISTYYPELPAEGRRKGPEYPNKYFVMYGDKEITSSTPAQRKEERKWRRWADDVLVHLISPNIYRTTEEAMQAFRYFDEVGEWEKHFSDWQRKYIVYLGSSVMYLVGKMLKRKYNLEDDVRQNLYRDLDTWIFAIKKEKRPFMGGNKPNMADLAVYGVLSSMEGCQAFQDCVENTKVKGWYFKVKDLVNNCAGSQARS